ncbi:MAG: UDP-N-acetylmuramoyl-L-alanine--D-glutamate ligase [Candidatus Saccharimonadales bacterium]
MSIKVGIIGGGIEGLAAARYWTRLQAEVTIHDANTALSAGEGVRTVLGPDYLKNLNNYDLVVRSPGVKPSLIKTKAPVTTGVKEFFKHCPARIIGVTGTKGKGTTSTLISKILEEAGKRVWLGGNIGRSPLDFLDKVKATDLVVLELSSFQLMDLDMSPNIAVCLMVVSEHMDWHGSIREYVAAKGNLFWHQQPGDVAIFNPKNDFSIQIASLSRGRKVPYLEAPGALVSDGQIELGGRTVCRADEVGLAGPHNLENICAALTAAHEIVGENYAAMKRAVISFKGLPHRLELAGEVGQVKYYDDSFSTTPETAAAAVQSFEQPKVVILGGSDKKSNYTELAAEIAKANVRQVILIGQMAGKIREALQKAGCTDSVDGGSNMTEIVTAAREVAQAGDVVLLSPACASFDMFKNYIDRGDQFKSAVTALEG